MYMPIYGSDISCNFQSSIEAPASSCPEWEVFFLLDENGKLLYSHRGKPQGLTLSKAQKYPMAKSSFCLFSLSLSLSLSPLAFGAQRGHPGKPGLHLSILLAEIRERETSHVQPLDHTEGPGKFLLPWTA